ncbi:MAG: hypothetical protein ACRCV5_12565 [Afipia sp.]
MVWPQVFEKQRRVILAAGMIGVQGRIQREAARYGAAACASLDALVYIDLRNRHLWPIKSTGHSQATAILQAQAWRSVSVLVVPYGIVLLAAPTAPEVISARAGLVLNNWPELDGLFEP